MKDHVIVVPSDNIVIVDKEPLNVDLSTYIHYHAIQWHDGTGHIEWENGTANTEIFGEAHYAQYIQVFEDLWQQEKDRQEYEATRPRTPEELKIIRLSEIYNRLNTLDFQLMRSMAEIINDTATDEDREYFSTLLAEKHELQAELKTLTEETPV